ncbi:amidohydrolase [Mesonia aquimarina]|uniref:amidohydrolase n=1 Tax=Mesonia aquimarina TaxID=1504967 RepID=UPI000EF59D10|nr:amidohydrolase [Mesonia aquimarina]
MDFKEIRHYLHRYPELSGEEKNTSSYLLNHLKKIESCTVHQGFSEHSLLAEINCKKPGKTVLFRAELDALPIKEENDFSYTSTKKNVSHKCGHDGHMTMLLFLAKRLEKEPISCGKILLLFQSSEETGEGADRILASKKLADFSIDYVLSLHNVPGYKKNTIVTKPGSFTPSVESVDIQLLGKTSHAGMPEKGINPALAVSEIIQYLNELDCKNTTDRNYFLATPIQLKMGKPAYGTSAGEAKISYTFRTWNHDDFMTKKTLLIDKINTIAKNHQLPIQWNWKEAFQANLNSGEAFNMIKEVAQENKLDFIETKMPFSWGEDFGSFTQQYNGAMFGLGAGKDCPELHNPDYDFPDEIAETGVNMFYSLAKKVLS